MDPMHIAIFGAALPAVVAAAVFLLTRWLRRGGDATADAGPAIAAGFLAGFIGVAGLPWFPVLDAWKWLFWIGVAGGALAVLASRVEHPSAAVRWTLRAALVAFATWETILPRTPLSTGGTFVAVMALLWFSDGLAPRVGASALLATNLVVAVCAAVTVGFSNSAMLAQVGGVLAAAVGGCLVLSWFLPASSRGAVALVTVLIAFVSLNGSWFADVPDASLVLLAAAVPAAWLAAGLLASASAHRRTAIVLAVTVLAAGSAVAVAAGRHGLPGE